ncbi:hypothetical protein Slin15195_G067060 [Septoria linicola]|uniref:Apple domain-containing protein n=1 Tax=Septoria linicola TaxID=215465 RepID=A0A9Q9EKK6_9PEZI|nr:hypothetical protein Slin14017_G099770 [Septoria linicola]USW53387.1 hypothetical protein Slin15195_G067060 [Septoria linicola]
MRTTVAFAAALAPLALAQGTLDLAQINNAPAPTATAPPEVNVVDNAAVEASLSSVVTAATASATAAPAKFRMVREADANPTFSWWPGTSTFDWNSKYCKAFWWKKECQKPAPEPPRPNPDPKPPTNPDPKPPVTPNPDPKPPVTQPPRTDRCEAQPVGAGPAVRDPDTPAAFLNTPAFRDAALGAATPSGYDRVFQNLQAAFQGNSYITFRNLDSYDTQACSNFCNSEKGCSSFNIYFERAPSLNPSVDATNQTANCPNPASTTYIRCALHGSVIDAKGATNSGQFREQFQVVIAGSNAYSKPGAPIDVPDYKPPQKCPDGGVGDKGKDWWIGDKFFPGAFNPDFCRIFAKVQTIKNIADAKAKGKKNYSPCNSFNAFEVFDSGKMVGTYCKLFTETLPIAWADHKSENKLGKLWELKNSWFYSIVKKDFGRL